jgi:hypothetical protein
LKIFRGSDIHGAVTSHEAKAIFCNVSQRTIENWTSERNVSPRDSGVLEEDQESETVATIFWRVL